MQKNPAPGKRSPKGTVTPPYWATCRASPWESWGSSGCETSGGTGGMASTENVD